MAEELTLLQFHRFPVDLKNRAMAYARLQGKTLKQITMDLYGEYVAMNKKVPTSHYDGPCTRLFAIRAFPADLKNRAMARARLQGKTLKQITMDLYGEYVAMEEMKQK